MNLFDYSFIYMYIFFFSLLILFFYIGNDVFFFQKKEHFCKIPKIDKRGGLNDDRVLLDYPPQSNILTSSCDQYWKDWPVESNNIIIDDSPIPIETKQLELPKEKQFANNDYKAGLIDFKKLAKRVSDPDTDFILSHATQLWIDPITQKPFAYEYELQFALIELNKKTWINRWKQYNPSIQNIFEYTEISSPIEKVNQFNMNFLHRCNILQKDLLTDKQLILFGLMKFQIYKYKILFIYYVEKNIQQPVYVMQISLLRLSHLYIDTFSYIGYQKGEKEIITEVQYLGRNATDSVLLPEFYDSTKITEQIINKHFDNGTVMEKDPDAITEITKKYQDSFKLKNQYACFNINYDINQKDSYILPYYEKELCESSYDYYGKEKNVGIFDSPCKKNEECPFYKANKNYDNEFGKCKEDGYCELPINMEPVGFHYFKTNTSKLPLCYNCNSKEFDLLPILDTCCDKQFDKEKYSFLNTPDYAFKDDYFDRKNFFNHKFCTSKPDSVGMDCKKIYL